MKWIVMISGAILFLLGALWLLQGLGIVTMAPILCFANCTPIQGPAPVWAAVGAAAIVVGFLLFRLGRKAGQERLSVLKRAISQKRRLPFAT